MSIKEICKVKAHDNIPSHYFCLWRVSKEFSTPKAYSSLKLQGVALIGCQCLECWGAYFKNRQIIFIKLQNFVIISFQIAINKYYCDI